MACCRNAVESDRRLFDALNVGLLSLCGDQSKGLVRCVCQSGSWSEADVCHERQVV